MPTDREKIEQWSLGYHLLKSYHDFCFKIYYKTTVVGLDKIPKDKSLIFAANHQNSLIDALAVLSMKTWQPVYLARADVFKSKTLVKILTFLKILPVYRIRDGYQNLQLNDDIFRKTLDVLKNHNGIGILPEGNHMGRRRLRPLKKGIARIAFQAKEACKDEIEIQIVPIGLNYSNYINLRSRLLIRIGDPIDINKHLDLYNQNPALAYNALIEDLEIGMKKEMIQIDDETCYDEYEMLREIYTPSYIKINKLSNGHNSHFEVDKKLIARVDELKMSIPNSFNKLMEDVRNYIDLIKKTSFTPASLRTSKLKLWGLVIRIPVLLITLPLFIYGFINNIIQIVLPYKLSKKVKDDQFISSIRFVAGMFLFPIMFIIQTVLFWAISGNGLYTLIYLASLPIGAALAYMWRKYALNVFADLKLISEKRSKPGIYQKLIDLDKSIKDLVGEI